METRFCLSCGQEFNPTTEADLLCRDCNRPTYASSSGQRTTREKEPSPAPPGVGTRLDRQAAQTAHRSPKLGDLSLGQGTLLENAGLTSDRFDTVGHDPTQGEGPAEWAAGDVFLDTYEVAGLLGEGGMGKVYRVHHRGWNLDLAVKSPHPHLFRSEADRRQFVDEAETWVKLGLHPHITSCYYVRTLDEVPRIFAELVEGGSLADWIAGQKIRTVEQALDVAIQFAWGLEYAHEQGLVHRDVKPANVLMNADGVAKVCDFGLARAKGGLTPAYCSPEQVDAEVEARSGKPEGQRRPLTAKSDVWSWGLSVLEMFAGRAFWVPAQAPNQAWGQLAPFALQSYLDGDVEAMIQTMPVGLAELLGDCFQKEPGARPASLAEIAGRLRDIYHQATGRAYPRQVPNAVELRAGSLNNKAISLMDLGRPAEAVQAWQEAVQTDPHHLEAVFNYGYWRWQQGEITDDALAEEIRALKSQHEHRSEFSWLAGAVEAERGNLDEAVSLLRQIGADSNWECTWLLAACLASQGQTQEAEAVLQQLWSGHAAGIRQRTRADSARSALAALQKERLPWRRCIRTVSDRQPLTRALHVSDGGRLVLTSAANQLRLYELESGQLLQTLKGHGGFSTLFGAALSPDGRRAVSIADDKAMILWDLERGRPLWKAKNLPDYPVGISVTPAFSHALLIDVANQLQQWDLQTGKCVQSIQLPGGDEKETRLVALRKDLGFALLVIKNELLGIDLHRQALVFRKPCRQDGALQLAMTPDGRTALTAGYDKTVWLWDVENARANILHGHRDVVNGAALSDDGRYGFTGSGGQYLHQENVVRLWSLRNQRCLWTSPKQEEEIQAVAISKDGTLGYALGQYGPIQQFTLDPGLEKNIHGFMPLPRVFTVPLSGQAALSAIERSRQILERAGEKERLNDRAGAYALLRQAQAESSDPWQSEILDRLARLWPHGRRVGLRDAVLRRSLAGHSQRVMDVALAPGTQLALSAGEDKTVGVWDWTSGQQLHVFRQFDDNAGCIAISGDGRYALVGGGGLYIAQDFRLRLFDLGARRLVHPIELGNSMVHDLCFGPDGRTACVASGRYLHVFEPLTGRHIHSIKAHSAHLFGQKASTGTTLCVAVTPDGRHALTGGDDQDICAWDLANGKRFRQLTGHTGSVKSLVLSEGGQVLVSASNDHTLKVWDLKLWECTGTIDTGGRVEHVAITPDARFAFSAGEDASIKVWSLKNGQPAARLEGHRNLVSGIALSQDCRYLISASWDQSLAVWELDWEYDYR